MATSQVLLYVSWYCVDLCSCETGWRNRSSRPSGSAPQRRVGNCLRSRLRRHLGLSCLPSARLPVSRKVPLCRFKLIIIITTGITGLLSLSRKSADGPH